MCAAQAMPTTTDGNDNSVESINKDADEIADAFIYALKILDEDYDLICAQELDHLQLSPHLFTVLENCETSKPVDEILERANTVLYEIERRHENMEREMKILKIKRQIHLLTQQRKSYEMKIKEKKRQYEFLEHKAAKLEESIQNMEDIDEKLESYRKEIMDIEIFLQDLGITPDFYPSNIYNRLDKLCELKQNVAEMQDKLKSFYDLPPNYIEALQVFRKAQKINEELAQKIAKTLCG